MELDEEYLSGNKWGNYEYDTELAFEENLRRAKEQEAVITLDKLRNIEAGITTVEKQEGPTGEKGDKPKHRWLNATQLQFENPDGTWGALVDLDPGARKIHQEVFETVNTQEKFKLTKGQYRMGADMVSWYLNGSKQIDTVISEESPTEIKILGGVPGGNTVMIEYIEPTLNIEEHKDTGVENV